MSLVAETPFRNSSDSAAKGGISYLANGFSRPTTLAAASSLNANQFCAVARSGIVCSTAGSTYSLPTAASLVGNLRNCAISDYFMFTVQNDAGAAITLQETGNAGNNVVVASGVHNVMLTLTNIVVPAYSLRVVA